MKVKIDPKHIHHFKEEVLNVHDNPTGQIKDVLQLDVQFPEHPELPTYGLRIDFPITRAKVNDAIRVKAQEAKAQMKVDEAVRNQLGAEILEFDIGV